MKKLIAISLMLFTLILSGCVAKQPIQIAYIAGLTGDLSEMGINGRNAFLMKVDEVNAAGGIKGRQIEVVVYDDENQPEKIPEIYADLREKEISLVAGHIISKMGSSVLEEAQKEDILIISATMSTTLIKGYDDYLIRTAVSTDAQSERLAEVIKADKTKSLLIINDSRNAQFVQDITENLLMIYDGDSTIVDFSPNENIEEEIFDLVEKNNYDGILLSIPAQEAALISQTVKDIDPLIQLYGITWAKTPELIQYGGKAVEGMKFTYRSQDEAYMSDAEDYFNQYKTVYKEDSSFVGELTYEMAGALFTAMENADDLSNESIKAQLVNHSYPGLTTEIIIDENGDRIGGYSLFQVVDGAFVPYEIK